MLPRTLSGMIDDIPETLASWSDAARVRRMNDAPLRDGSFILCWLQQALRAYDNPTIDAAIRLGNDLNMPVVVYHGLRENYPFASDRLHTFVLGASRDLARGCADRGLACVQFVDRPAKREKGLVYRLAERAAAVVVEDQPSFVAQWQSERFAARTNAVVFAINAACLVPPAALDQGIGTTPAFRRRHERLRAAWSAWTDEVPAVGVYAGPLPFRPDHLASMTDADIDQLVTSCIIDHDVLPSAMFPATRCEVVSRLSRLRDEVLSMYAGTRNDATRPEGSSTLSPYLHFGMVGPREILAAIAEAEVPEASRSKFADELLTWREWFHYRAHSLPVPECFTRVPNWARKSLEAHADDPRPDVETLDALLHGETRDETWNACQKQYLLDGWMHNNLRMYWAKRLIAMTPDPRTGWATACYLNDRLSLDGRDPSTYGNLAWAFGDSAPGYGTRPVYGLVASRTDKSIRARPNGPQWIAKAATRPVRRLDVPETPPDDPYLTEILPI